MQSDAALVVDAERSAAISRTPRVLQLEGQFDIAAADKTTRQWHVELPLDAQPWSIGAFIGPSGSGKSTLLVEAFGPPQQLQWHADRAIVDEFPDDLGIMDITGVLSSVGFSSPPAWLRPFDTLCADSETEILTVDGWRSYEQLSVGDRVLTLDHESGCSEWQAVEALNVYHVENEPMLHIERKNHSSLTTGAHRWPVVLASTGERAWRTSLGSSWQRLNTNHHVVTAAPCSDLPAEAKWSDALVELIAWFYTEGHIIPNKHNGGRVVLTQCSRTNPSKVARIRAALVRYAGAPRRRERGQREQCSWHETSDGSVARFILAPGLAAQLLELAPDKVPTMEFLRSLTRAQLELFLVVSRLGDGWTVNSGTVMFAQNDSRRVDAYEMAVILSGRTPSRWTTVRRHEPCVGSLMYFCSMRERSSVRPVMRTSTAGTIEQLSYTGVVWCPTTANGTWMARRHGRVYFTGNSNGEKFRAEIARLLVESDGIAVVDEFTSVVDRTVARIGSSAVAKFVRSHGRQLVVASCHFDIVDWLQPDWVYDTGGGTFTWRCLQRRPDVNLEVYRTTTAAWSWFRHHHYLSSDLSPAAQCFVCLVEGRPAAFIGVLPVPGIVGMRRASRAVTLPDFQGIGLGNWMIAYVGSLYRAQGFRYTATMSHPAFIHHLARSADWKMLRAPSRVGRKGRTSALSTYKESSRRFTASFEYVGPPADVDSAVALDVLARSESSRTAVR